MPNWKKLIVSGSDASLNSLNVTNNVTAQSFTGSFSGSFTAPGATTQIVYNNGGALAADSGLVYSGSRVGIGTTSPARLLHIKAGSGATGAIRVDSDNGNVANVLEVTTAGDWSFNTNSQEVMRLYNASGGRVGIGTTSPQNKLHISGSASSDAANIRIDSTDQYGGLVINENTTLRTILGYGNAGNIFSNAQTDSAALRGANYLHLGASSVATITINGGNDYVGIGTTSPAYKLDVQGSAGNIARITDGTSHFLFYAGSGLNEIATTGPFLFTVSGSERMRITTAGNVGIGTTSPGAKLHVASGEIRVDAGQAVTLDTGNVMYLVGASSQLRLYNGGNPIVNITTGGNVGIGTTSPSQVLEVQGQAQIGNDNVTSAGLFIARKNSNQAKSHYFLSAQESPTYQWIEGGYFTSELAGVSVANNSGKPYYEAYSPAGQYKTFGFINQQTSGSSFTSTAATASMVLYQGGDIALAPTQGNVGIGTTTPAASLHTIGSTNFTQIVQSTTSIAYTQYYNSSTGTGGTNDGLTIGLNGTSGLVYLRENADLFFGTADTERMRITSGGNVGIGTSSPSTKLDVIGNSYISGSLSVKTTSTAGTGLTVGGSTVLLSFAEIQQGNLLYLYSSGNTYYSTIRQDSQNLILTPDTNVGIGTSSPSQKLDVAGAISVSGSVIDYEVSPGLIGPGPAVNIISFTPGTHYAAFVDYVIKDASTGANQRVGTIQISISLAAAAAVLNEVTTVDIGNTSAITFAVAYGAPTWLTATNSGITPYDINYMVRYF